MGADNPTRATLESIVKSHLAKKTDFFIKRAEAVKRLSANREMLEDDQMITAHDCHVLGCGITKAASNGQEPGRGHYKRLQRFNDDVIDLRNTLAHVAEELDGVGQTILRSRRKGKEDLVLNAETCAKIRKSLRDYRSLFSELAPFFGVKIN